MSSDEDVMSVEEAPKPKKPPKKKIEDIYQKKTQLEHILLRPDTYIGSVEPVTDNMWILDSETQKLTQRKITYVPGLYKIFDEILVNAADNKQRDKNMDSIKININAEKNEISVWNNGMGIPVVVHKDENMYVPTMIFGHLLTSSNYDDEEEKVTGGRNGYGAKLCNIFSTKFTVETSNKKSGKKFKQTWKDNMSLAGEVKIADTKQEDYTCITFQPDLAKFKMVALDQDIIDLMSRRAYDVAASTGGVKVFLNGKRVPVKNFKDYVELLMKDKERDEDNPPKIIYEKVNNFWEVAVSISDSGFQQNSFVNSISTFKGGRHVDYVTDMLVKQLLEVIKKKNKGGVAVKPFQIRNHMWVFVNCLIVNPTFDSQTKENMTLQAKNFKTQCKISEKFINAVLKSGITEAVLTWAKLKAQSQLDKVGGGRKKTKLRGIPKLEDANDAASKNSMRCTMIITEGDSAKSLAVSGLGVVGRDRYGVFPVRGKLLNVREASHKQIMENAEIKSLISIFGLQYKKKYNTLDDLKTLRYGKLMIMADQDQDGSHIKGLIINFFHTNWPELLRLPFLEEFITPIVKASKKNQVFSFYSIPEFDEWKRDTPNHNTYHIKYYKGLGTSTSKEAKEYFENMDRHRIKFEYGGEEDDYSIRMAFSKKCADDRKTWLKNWMDERKRRFEMGLPEMYLYEKNTKKIKLSEFVNKELVLFSNGDNVRSIPNMIDGLKPGQRKVIFTCFKRNDKREVKVAQLAGSVAEHSAYHHGEAALNMTIVNMAQNYVGSNNINLLLPNGQFGTRLQGGKDAASPRYIFTMLSPVTRELFNSNDVPLLIKQTEENQRIEPLCYCPIIPMVLVNGAEGIGTGWMTKIPNYNPREIVENIRAMLHGDPPTKMKPWYKGFKGTVEDVGNQRYLFSGEVLIIDDATIEITELPVGTWTQNYKESVLEPMLHGGEKIQPTLLDFKEYHTDTTVRFVITMTPAQLATYQEKGLHNVFKLQNTYSNTQLVLFDELGCLTRFQHVNEILERFFTVRLKMYEKRKEYLLGKMTAEAKKLSNQARFILEKCDGSLVVENKKKRVMIDELIAKKFDSDPVRAWLKDQDKDDIDEPVDDGEEENDIGIDFDYLLGMKLWSLTLERKLELLKQRDDKLKELSILQNKSPAQLWNEDLDKFLEVLEAHEAAEQADTHKVPSKVKGAGGKKPLLKAETMPSPHGCRVIPTIDPELLKKIERAVNYKEKRKDKIAKKESAVDVEDDEFDNMANVKPLEQRIGNSPQMVSKKLQQKRKELKQTKLNFEKGSETEDDECAIPPEPRAVPPEPRAVPRRQAAAKAKFTFDSDDDEQDIEPHANGNWGDSSVEDSTPPKRKRVFDSDSEDSDFGIQKKKTAAAKSAFAESSESLFDKLMSGGEAGASSAPTLDSSSENNIVTVDSSPEKMPPSKPQEPGPKKAPAKPRAPKVAKAQKPRKPAGEKPKPKKAVSKSAFSNSDSDSDAFEVKAKGKKKKKMDNTLSDSDSADNDIPIIPRETTGRARKPVSYKIDLTDSEDE